MSFLAGGVAGGIEAAATVSTSMCVNNTNESQMTKLHQYPFEFAKTRVQLRSEKGDPVPRNPFLVVANVFREEGARALYRGCSSSIVVGAKVSC